MTTASSSELVLPLLQRFYSLETIAREPWDQESVLYVPKDRLIFVDGSSGADSIAALIYLNTLNLRFTIRRVNNANQMSPSGIGPLLKCGRFSLGEYEPIVNFCNLKGFRLLSDYLNHSNKSFVKSYILLIQKAFSDTISYFLWKNESTPQKMLKSIFRESYVWPLSDILYYNEYSYAKKRLEAIKLWNCEPKQVLNRFIEVIDSLNRKLEGGNLYLIDKRLTEADLILYSYIKFVKSHTGLTPIAHELYNFKNLSDFYANLNEKYEQLIKDELNI